MRFTTIIAVIVLCGAASAVALSPESQKIVQFLAANKSPKTALPLSYKVPSGYWLECNCSSPTDPSNTAERILATFGLNLYDGAVWQIAMTLGGNFDAARAHTQMLLTNRCGDLADIRACNANFTYGDNPYNCTYDNSYFFRMISDVWANHDPLTGQIVTWMDWRPITGENVWLSMIGPLQSAYIKFGSAMTYDMPEVKLALSVLKAVHAMQSPIGALYYAPGGTYGAVLGEISTENNASGYAGLRILKQILQMLHDPENLIPIIDNLMQGIEKYMRQYAFNAQDYVFYQGGTYDHTSKTFIPSSDFAVDVQTWGLTVFSELVDTWLVPGAAYKIWNVTKSKGGFYDASGAFQGVGYSSQTTANQVLSGEWTYGAINMARTLSQLYSTTNPQFSASLAQDADVMYKALAAPSMRTVYPDGSIGIFYANKRYFIPFGWWSNPIPSTASSGWNIFLNEKFNPFVLGGTSL
eukprot:TRINITY_DN668_c0_g1_i6.p1 TRINITY_DN668_c0_g1~~TRINITY_DN668_c0_g1_i6.p1  ORF type:complete len:468 (+),score=188.43 TRINITY_DN668_c0_g1_i6:98-1501(+)